jgi:hypothetical protein
MWKFHLQNHGSGPEGPTMSHPEILWKKFQYREIDSVPDAEHEYNISFWFWNKLAGIHVDTYRKQA